VLESNRKDKQMDSRFRKLNILNLQEVEQEIDLLISISDNPSDELIKEVTSLIQVAKALGSKRVW
jgi:hypothetical protein